MKEIRENSGALFKNDTEGKPENFPGYGGSVRVGGVDYYISAWLKESNRGKFFSLSFKPKSETGKAGIKEAKAAVAPQFDDESFDSDVPF